MRQVFIRDHDFTGDHIRITYQGKRPQWAPRNAEARIVPVCEGLAATGLVKISLLQARLG
jgi:hypothetical protein